MKRTLITCMAVLMMAGATAQDYTPTAENLAARKEFSEDRFGIFLHWGIYSLFGQGEWYLNNGQLSQVEYQKSADAFYPHRFNAHDWVAAIKGAGAKYICITSRHHDGFSMFHTKHSTYNIVDATPFGRDVLKELADECHKQGIHLHFYYSHLDWGRTDYPLGRTGGNTGRDTSHPDFNHYFEFMNNQLTELLTNYGDIRCIWFDGVWDHDSEDEHFDWRLEEQYRHIHKIRPACLVGNNHHKNVVPGEDIQLFERDVPGNNSAGWNNADISTAMPLETCETMNGMWGYKVNDQNYKSTPEIISWLVRSAGQNANLLLNLGPQPNGELPATGLQRLSEVGEWMKTYGKSIYATQGGPIKPQDWGATTVRNDTLFVHILKSPGQELSFPLEKKVKQATLLKDGSAVDFVQAKGNLTLTLPEKIEDPDYVIQLKMKK